MRDIIRIRIAEKYSESPSTRIRAQPVSILLRKKRVHSMHCANILNFDFIDVEFFGGGGGGHHNLWVKFENEMRDSVAAYGQLPLSILYSKVMWLE